MVWSHMIKLKNDIKFIFICYITKVVNARTDMLDGRQDFYIGGDTPKTEIMKSSQNRGSGEIRIRLGQISHRSERLRIDQQ